MARATSSFPVPVSPVIRTVESVLATLLTSTSTRRSGAGAPHFLIGGTPRGDAVPPVLHDAFAVLRMDHFRPLPHEGLVLAKTRLHEQAAGDEVDGAIRPGGTGGAISEYPSNNTQ